jgi:hypothetical protein
LGTSCLDEEWLATKLLGTSQMQMKHHFPAENANEDFILTDLNFDL